jgi:hypothetical protein
MQRKVGTVAVILSFVGEVTTEGMLLLMMFTLILNVQVIKKIILKMEKWGKN